MLRVMKCVLLGVLFAVVSAGGLKAEPETAPSKIAWSDDFQDDWPSKWQLRKWNWGPKHARVEREPDGLFPHFLRNTSPFA
jgi:hypothetical protein